MLIQIKALSLYYQSERQTNSQIKHTVMETKDLRTSKETLELLNTVLENGCTHVVFCTHHYRGYTETKTSTKHGTPCLVSVDTEAKREIDAKEAFKTKSEAEGYAALFPITTIDSGAICFKYTDPIVVDIAEFVKKYK